jgi:hypothetical protein
MGTYVWLCTQGCTWEKGDDYHDAIRAHCPRPGRLSTDFPGLNQAIQLSSGDAFCIEGLGLSNMSDDLPSNTFSLSGTWGQDIVLYGHKSKRWDLYYLVGVCAGGPTDRGARPDSWKERARKQTILFSDLHAVFTAW